MSGWIGPAPMPPCCPYCGANGIEPAGNPPTDFLVCWKCERHWPLDLLASELTEEST